MKFSIGQVSKLYNISKDTLRHYDKIGILKPNVNKENGYRFYSLKHLDKLEMILATKYFGISLFDIKTVIESEDILNYKELIMKQEILMKKKIRELETLEKEIKKSKDTLDNIIKFKNEYNLDKVKIKKQVINLYGIDMSNLINVNIYQNYINSINNELNFIGEEEYCYMYNIKNNIINENKNLFFIKENKFNSEAIKRHLINDKVKVMQKNIRGNVLSVRFYGTNTQIKDYIIYICNYFDISIEKEVFISYEFYLSKKTDEEMYFVKIYLEIEDKDN